MFRYTLALFTAVLVAALPVAGNQATVVSISAHGEWQCPAGVTSVYVECWGAGAPAGMVGEPRQQTWSGGGGGGAYAASRVAVVPGKKYGAYPAISSSFQTSFDAKVVADSGYIPEVKRFPGDLQTDIAAGGKGGMASKSIGDVVYSGGDGGRGGVDGAGGGGGVAGPSGNGAPGQDGSGKVGGLPGGNGSKGHSFADEAKDYGEGPSYVKPAGFPGGGMGGGLNRSTHGGGKGLIRITY